MNAFRLLIDSPADGVRNMAVDEALLAAAHAADAPPALRWYQWKVPTLSLGYFQRWEDVPMELQSLPRVRRSTGGGAILHADELTYSLVFPTGTWPRSQASEIVADVHAAVASVVEGLSPALFVSTARAVSKPSSTEVPFLCFDRRSPNDLVVGADKIMGSAQRRQGGRLLQHGSIKLRDLNSDDVIERVTNELVKRWNVEFTTSTMTSAEHEFVEQFANKHRSIEWTQRR